MPVRVPSLGGVTTEKVSGSPSTSVACSVNDTGVSSLVGTVVLVGTGGSFTGFTWSATVPGSDVTVPSDTV